MNLKEIKTVEEALSVLKKNRIRKDIERQYITKELYSDLELDGDLKNTISYLEGFESFYDKGFAEIYIEKEYYTLPYDSFQYCKLTLYGKIQENDKEYLLRLKKIIKERLK